jgi:hypothetical protein
LSHELRGVTLCQELCPFDRDRDDAGERIEGTDVDGR